MSPSRSTPAPDVAPRPGDLDEQGIADLRKVFPASIRRIEREARRAAIEEVRDALLGPQAPVDAVYERHTRAVLDELVR